MTNLQGAPEATHGANAVRCDTQQKTGGKKHNAALQTICLGLERKLRRTLHHRHARQHAFRLPRVYSRVIHQLDVCAIHLDALARGERSEPAKELFKSSLRDRLGGEARQGNGTFRLAPARAQTDTRIAAKDPGRANGARFDGAPVAGRRDATTAAAATAIAATATGHATTAGKAAAPGRAARAVGRAAHPT